MPKTPIRARRSRYYVFITPFDTQGSLCGEVRDCSEQRYTLLSLFFLSSLPPPLLSYLPLTLPLALMGEEGLVFLKYFPFMRNNTHTKLSPKLTPRLHKVWLVQQQEYTERNLDCLEFKVISYCFVGLLVVVLAFGGRGRQAYVYCQVGQ